MLASGLPMHHGAQLAVDIAMRSALTANGSACSPNAAHTDGAVLLRARLVKERKYHELLDTERCHLVVVGVEVGGRLSTESVDFVTDLAGSKSQEAPPLLKGSAFFAWRRRWMRMLSISCARSFASSLVLTRSHAPEGQVGWAPDVADLFQFSWCAPLSLLLSFQRVLSAVPTKRHIVHSVSRVLVAVFAVWCVVDGRKSRSQRVGPRSSGVAVFISTMAQRTPRYFEAQSFSASRIHAPKQQSLPRTDPLKSKITRFEAALKVLGQEQSEARACLEEALKKAKTVGFSES